MDTTKEDKNRQKNIDYIVKQLERSNSKIKALELLELFQKTYEKCNENIKDAANIIKYDLEPMCQTNQTVSEFLFTYRELLLLAGLMNDLVSIRIICHLAGDKCLEVICSILFNYTSAILYAIETGNSIVVEELFAHGGQEILFWNKKVYAPLAEAIHHRKHAIAQLLINKAGNQLKEILFFKNPHGTALHEATQLHYEGDEYNSSMYNMIEIILKAAGDDGRELISMKNGGGSIAFDAIEKEYRSNQITEATYDEFKKLFEKYNAHSTWKCIIF